MSKRVRQREFPHEVCIRLSSIVSKTVEWSLVGKTPTSQLPPPTELVELDGPVSPKVNILNSPLEMTTKTSIQFRPLALRFEVSQNCLRQSMPSLAQGAPKRASSSSEMLTEVETVSILPMLRESSSCVSLMMECDRFDAKPRVGA